MQRLLLMVVALVLSPLATACDLKYAPAASVQFVRPEGWKLPGVQSSTDVNPNHPSFSSDNRGAFSSDLPGVTATLLRDRNSYIADFPAQVFLLDGTRQRLKTFTAKATVLGFQLNGRTFAYGYSLVPVHAHRSHGRWIVDAEAACVFDITFIDDRGDGVFRVLTRNRLTPAMIPAWVRRPPRS
jgi:hypothetical protein